MIRHGLEALLVGLLALVATAAFVALLDAVLSGFTYSP